MEAFDMAWKLSLAGKLSPVPFKASPIYISSQVGSPMYGSCRVFVPMEHWTDEGLMDVAREIASTLGPTEQFDVGIAPEESAPDEPGASRSGEPARLTKLDPESDLILLMVDGFTWKANYPRLDFHRIGVDEWRSLVEYGGAANPVRETP